MININYRNFSLILPIPITHHLRTTNYTKEQKKEKKKRRTWPRLEGSQTSEKEAFPWQCRWRRDDPVIFDNNSERRWSRTSGCRRCELGRRRRKLCNRPSSRRRADLERLLQLFLCLSFSSRVNTGWIKEHDGEGDRDEEGRQEVIRDKGTRRGTVLSKVRHRYDEGIIHTLMARVPPSVTNILWQSGVRIRFTPLSL